MLSIGAFSRLCQVSIKTLRFYHEVGLLVPAHVNRSSGYRYYAARQLNDVQSILAFKAMGFSLDEIETLLSNSIPTRQMRDLLLEKRAQTQEMLRDGEKRVRRIDVALDQIERGWQIGDSELAVRKMPCQLVAGIREILPGYDAAAALLDELKQHVKRQGVSGALGAIWHSCGNAGNLIDCEVVAFLNKGFSGNNRVRVYELPAATIASSVHQGDADFNASYLAANKWIRSNGWRRVGPNRELYLRGGYSDSESAIMEIQFPIEPKIELRPEAKANMEGRAKTWQSQNSWD
ncbi:MAG TPA: MerR family transcriptional regulator [Blastocatellia bacterium]